MGEDEVAPLGDTGSSISTTPACESTKKSALGSKLKSFLMDSLNSKAVMSAFVVSVLLSFSLGMTIGIVPEILTDRYARLYHGYGISSSSDGDNGDGRNSLQQQPCWDYEIRNMPEACVMGADDAQTGSAYGMLVQNLLTFFFNAVLGSYSDTQGRRPLLMVSILLNAMVPAALLALQVLDEMDPFWYYAANASTGFISFPSMIFAMMSDDCPEEHRAGRFAVNMAGFYVGFAIAPMLPVYMGHTAASWWSFALAVVMVLFSAVSLPETLPSLVVVASNNEENNNRPYPFESVFSPISFSSEGETREGFDDDPSLGSDEVARCPTPRCLQSTKNLLLRPFSEMSILLRDGLKLLALGSFLSAAVYSVDSSLVLFYIEEYLNVREADIGFMFLVMGILGVVLQGFSLQPLVYLLGEHGLLVVTFGSGTLHNFLYGVATTKKEITIALGLSQLTKLSYPLLSSLASQRAGVEEQGRVQGALLALNALAGALGPVSMNWVYEKTKDGTHKPFGPGTMFLLSSGLYFLGMLVVSQIPRGPDAGTETSSSSSSSSDRRQTTRGNDENEAPESSVLWHGGDLEEPLLLRLGDTITI